MPISFDPSLFITKIGKIDEMIQLEKLKNQIAGIQDINEFFRVCNEGMDSSTQNWFCAALELEKSFDVFMQQLASLDKMTAVKFAAVFARYAFEHVRDEHMEQVREIGMAFLASDPCMDGESIEKQLQNVEVWLKEPSQENKGIVLKGIDPSRQMNVWDEDLFPSDDQMWLWIYDTAQLLSLAVKAGDSEEYDHDMDELPYSWSYKACISRSAHCSLKSIAKENRELAEDLTNLLRKVGAELES